MKPGEARARKQILEAQRAARGERMERFLRDGGDVEQVQPELIPTEDDRAAADRELRQALHEVERLDRHSRRRTKLMDSKVIPAMAKVIYIDRVLRLDPLERAGLRPRQLAALSMIRPSDLQTKLGELRRAAVPAEKRATP